MKIPSQYFKQDAEGTWWHEGKAGRKRASIRTCPHCKEEFLSYEKRRHCSHACAMAAYHARLQPTTRFSGELKNSDNPRFSKDEKGQWWYRPQGTKDHGRTRARIETCANCKTRFLVSIFHNKKVPCCSRSCGLRLSYAKDSSRFKGKNSRAWKGGRYIDRKGYVQVWSPDHPRRDGSTKKLYTLEHRLVMEKVLGRYLEPHEEVHHKNGQRDDNRPENLELWIKRQPGGQRVQDLIAWAHWIIDTYGHLTLNGPTKTTTLSHT